MRYLRFCEMLCSQHILFVDCGRICNSCIYILTLVQIWITQAYGYVLRVNVLCLLWICGEL